MEQLTVHATPTSQAPYDVSIQFRVAMTITYFHQTQTIYMTIDGHVQAEAPLDDAGAPSVVDIQATTESIMIQVRVRA